MPLDKSDQIIRPAKLWCDTSTVEECEIITDTIGGEDSVISMLGNRMLPGFTAPKILWLKRHEPENFDRLSKVLLPHDYLNFYLTGEWFMEFGDASGTALMDVRTRVWSDEVIGAIDGRIRDCLPGLSSSTEACGVVRRKFRRSMGFPRPLSSALEAETI